MSFDSAVATCEALEALQLLLRELQSLERGFAEADRRLEKFRQTVLEELNRTTSPCDVVGLVDLL